MKEMKYLILILLVTAFFSCSIQPVHRDDPDVKKKPKIIKKGRGYGPPPHAPAHGYRHKHQQGVELRYDSGLGVYVVIDIPDMYFNDGLYIRWSPNGYWQVGNHYNGPWRAAVGNEVPGTLDKKKGNYNKGKGRGRGKGKGRGLYK